MRTCPMCGCYMPDNWTICPSCNSQERIEVKIDTANVYCVDTFYYNDQNKDRQYFGIRENAEKYAIRQLVDRCVTATQIIYRGKILETFFSNRY